MIHYEIIIGPMFSGKTTELYRRINRYKCIGKNVLIINHSNDTRTSGISTHDGHEYNAIKVSNEELENIERMDDWENIDVIGIDEAQFFPNLKEFILKFEKSNKKVIVAGLDATSDRVPFGNYNILDTIPLCNKIDKLNALCMKCRDGTLGYFTKRISDEKGEKCIGGIDKYMAVCRKDFLCD